LNENQTLGQISQSIQQLNPAIDDLEYYTVDGALIPECEFLKDRNNSPFILSIKRKDSKIRHNYALNLNDAFSIDSRRGSGYKSKTSEEAYLDYCLGIGLPQYSSYLLANFASKIHQTLPQNCEKFDNASIITGL